MIFFRTFIRHGLALLHSFLTDLAEYCLGRNRISVIAALCGAGCVDLCLVQERSCSSTSVFEQTKARHFVIAEMCGAEGVRL